MVGRGRELRRGAVVEDPRTSGELEAVANLGAGQVALDRRVPTADRVVRRRVGASGDEVDRFVQRNRLPPDVARIRDGHAGENRSATRPQGRLRDVERSAAAIVLQRRHLAGLLRAELHPELDWRSVRVGGHHRDKVVGKDAGGLRVGSGARRHHESDQEKAASQQDCANGAVAESVSAARRCGWFGGSRDVWHNSLITHNRGNYQI